MRITPHDIRQLSVRGLRLSDESPEGVDFEVRAGEIVGVAALEGQGQDTLFDGEIVLVLHLSNRISRPKDIGQLVDLSFDRPPQLPDDHPAPPFPPKSGL